MAGAKRIAVCAGHGFRAAGRVCPAGKVRRGGIGVATAGSTDKPWIERVVASPGVRSGYLSLVAHVLVCLLLAILVLEAEPKPQRRKPTLVAFDSTPDVVAGDAAAADVAVAEIAVTDAAPAAGTAAAPVPEAIDDVREAAPPIASPFDDVPGGIVDPAAEVGVSAEPVRPPASVPVVAGQAAAPTAGASSSGAGPSADGTAESPFASRVGAARAAASAARGGSPASEAAVERGLQWLAAHQAVDGSWQFDLAGCRCDGACRDPGTIDSSTASTAIALLPFLGAGNTHAGGPYQETVARGVYFLLSRMKATPRGGDLCEGTMYGHGVAALVLAETLGMTKDEFLVQSVRDTVRFIETSQDLHGGGWRYLPGQAGDITVTAWQLAAVKSAALAGVETPSPTIEGVCRFLDRVQTQNGAAYGYRTPSAKPCTSAIGLLCRMYTGWGRDKEPLRRGLTNLAKPGPSPSAIYQNFYLSQALLQFDHPVWPRWNARNRDQIVQQQARFGHETGSWFFAEPDTAPGGRLAHTALAVLTLEVYYRLLPIYGKEAVEGGF